MSSGISGEHLSFFPARSDGVAASGPPFFWLHTGHWRSFASIHNLNDQLTAKHLNKIESSTIDISDLFLKELNAEAPKARRYAENLEKSDPQNQEHAQL